MLRKDQDLYKCRVCIYFGDARSYYKCTTHG